MTDYKVFEKKRRVKQMFLAAVFVLVLMGGWFYPLLGFFIPACMALGLSIAFSRGRKWCDWYCPRGSFWDYVLKPFSPKKEIPLIFKNMVFRISVLTLLMAAMTFQIIKRWPNPYKIGSFFVLLLTVTTGLGIILALFLHQRLWCYLCPIGSISNLAGRNKKPLYIDSETCVECKMCAKVCPMQIKPYAFKKQGREKVGDFDCLKCASCVAACPKKSLSL